MPKTTSNSSVAAEHDIIHKRGDTFWRGFKYWQDKARTIPIDITSSTFNMDVVRAPGQKALFSFSLENGLSITGINILELDMEAIVAQVPAGIYLYDLQKTLSSGRVVTIMKGAVIIEQDVTPVPT